MSGQVRLTWLAPTSNGGSAVTDYVIQRSPNGTTGWVTISDGVNINTAYTVAGLVNGTRYYFRVFAHNAAGNSPASNVGSAIPRTLPTAPRSLTAAPTNLSGQVRLTWLAPTSNGGSAVTDYIVQRSPNGTTGWTTISDGVNTNTAYTVTGLVNGTRYYFRVFAHNAAGNSPTSNVANAIPRTVPGYVSFVRVTAYPDGFDFSWGDPVSTGGSPITGFVFQAYDYDTSSWFTVGTVSDPTWREAFLETPVSGLRDLPHGGQERRRYRSVPRTRDRLLPVEPPPICVRKNDLSGRTS